MKQETKNLTKYLIIGVGLGLLFVISFTAIELSFLVYVYNPFLEEQNDTESIFQTLLVIGIPLCSGLFVGQKINNHLSKKYHYDNDTLETKGNGVSDK